MLLFHKAKEVIW